jgi:mannan endo-1,4-beta-mannosidase
MKMKYKTAPRLRSRFALRLLLDGCWNVRRIIATVLIALGATWLSASGQTVASPHAAPANQNATPEARLLLKQIDQISGHFTLTGQHNFPNHVSRWSDRLYDLTGKFPAIFGQDFGFAGGDDKDSVEGRPSMIEEAKRQYRNGAVVALTWHAVRPTEDEPVTFRDSVQGHLTDFEWNELLTPGTNLHSRWVEQVDVIAGYLRQLQAAGVPVLFRPYHEMNGNWFWWGGRPGEHGSAALYRQLYDRFVNVHHLNNLVWVWNVNSPGGNAGSIESYYPGAQYADVVTMDIYGEFKQNYYDDMVALAGDKPIALAEVGAMPTLDVLAKQPRWAYFMMWSGMGESVNSLEQLQTMFHAPNLLNRGDAPFSPPATAAGDVEPVTQHALAGVKETLDRLYAVQGTHVLSGQMNAAGDPIAATERVAQVTTKFPAIYAADLDTTSGAQSAKAVLDEGARQSAAKSIVSLRWLAPNPAAIEKSAQESAGHDSRAEALTDFEWKELITPGTHLNDRWCAQVDEAAAILKQLESKGIPIMWTPYPEPNGKQYWWAGHAGIHGSAALYRMLFDRLVNHDQVHNLVWVWEAAPPSFGPGSTGSLGDYFPGLLYIDTLELEVSGTQTRFRSDVFLKSFGVDKVIGLAVDAPVVDPAFFARETNWTWFSLAPQPSPGADAPSNEQALRTLYEDSRVVTR